MQQANLKHMDHLSILILQTLETIQNAWAHFWFKVPICFILAGFAFFFGLSNGSFLLMLVTLIGFDLVMGISAAYKAGEPIESRRALKTATKLGVYGILVSSAFLVENIVPSITLIDNAMISFLALTEFISIIENAGKMGFVVPQKLLNQVVAWRNQK